MVDMLADSNVWLEGQRHSYLSSEIEFRRGVESVSLSATIGKTDYQVEDFEGNLLTAQSIDFIVRPDDLGSLIPQQGDRITRNVGCDKLTYEVWTPTGEELFVYDTQRLSMRIHTQLISEDLS